MFLYAGPGVYPGPGFYLKFYGSTVIILITGWSPELSHIGLCRQDSLHSSQKVCVCSVRQSGEHFGSNHRLPIVRYRKDYAGEHSKLLQLQYSKTVVSLVCIGAVSGLYYSSLDRQSRRKFRATADGVIRFVRYWYWDYCLLLLIFDWQFFVVTAAVPRRATEVHWDRIFFKQYTVFGMLFLFLKQQCESSKDTDFDLVFIKLILSARSSLLQNRVVMSWCMLLCHWFSTFLLFLLTWIEVKVLEI